MIPYSLVFLLGTGNTFLILLIKLQFLAVAHQKVKLFFFDYIPIEILVNNMLYPLHKTNPHMHFLQLKQNNFTAGTGEGTSSKLEMNLQSS